MRILAIDSAESQSSVALLSDDGLFTQSAEQVNAHAKVCLSVIDALLTDRGWTLADVDYYAYAHGPGSYTGLRVGAGVLQGLHLVHPKPIVHITSAAAYAHAVLAMHLFSRYVRIVRNAYGGACYHCVYSMADEKLKLERAPAMSELDALPDDGMMTYFIPPLLPLEYKNNKGVHLFEARSGQTQAARVAQLAWQSFSGKYEAEIYDKVQPLYLKKASDWQN